MHIKFNDLFQQIQEQQNTPLTAPNPNTLIELINRVRPQNVNNTEEIRQNLQALIQALLITPSAAIDLQCYLLRLINHYKQTSLYADSGILSLDGFWNQLGQRLGAHILPLLRDETDLRDLIGKIFHQSSDQQWLESIDDELWRQLFKLLNNGYGFATEKTAIKNELLKAITVLSYRISGIGLYPEFINAQPELSEYESPFLVQNREIIEFIEA